ncbi:hypothetical protein NL676_026266 [Syzygium grande]|nr:hypothetical protein NL676_026266 [Syzygium grande]
MVTVILARTDESRSDLGEGRGPLPNLVGATKPSPVVNNPHGLFPRPQQPFRPSLMPRRPFPMMGQQPTGEERALLLQIVLVAFCCSWFNEGTAWTACVHVIAVVIGSGVLSLAWATAQLGWIAGPAVILLFSCVTCSSPTFLANCYRCGNPVTGERNYSYMNAVHSILGRSQARLYGLVQYPNFLGAAIAVTIASSISMMVISRSSCFHKKGDSIPRHMSSNPYMIGFGAIEIVLSQILDFNQQWWLPIVATVMSVTYSTIGLSLGIAKGSLTGISIGTAIQTQKIWRSFQALGIIAFAYSFAIMHFEIQDTVRSPPSEAETMRKAVSVSMAVMTLLYILCGCMGYAAFRDMAPGHLLAGLGSVRPYWLNVVANVAIVIHLAGAYQVYSQPVFAFIEKHARRRFAASQFITREIKIPILGFRPFKLYVYRLIGRTFFIMVTTRSRCCFRSLTTSSDWSALWGSGL